MKCASEALALDWDRVNTQSWILLVSGTHHNLVALQEDMPYLHTALARANPELQQACLFPSYQQLAVFAEQHHHLDLSDALELFADR